MVISFSSFQCKRAHPPEVESIEAVKPLGAWGASITMTEKDMFYRDYTMDFVVPPPAVPILTDPITHKQFKVPTSPNEHAILKMFKFYGIDINKTYQCPACPLKADMRTLLPHLNNDQGINVFMIEGYENRFESHGWNFKQLGEWLESLGC